jgi:hypothetical protein
MDFLSDMGEPPTVKHTLGRIDNNGNYEPGNVRWETRLQQQQNRSCTIRLEFHGETKTLSEWARHFNMHYKVLYCRIKSGMTIEDAISKPVQIHQRRTLSAP